jgi:hypothetical protein
MCEVEVDGVCAGCWVGEGGSFNLLRELLDEVRLVTFVGEDMLMIRVEYR